MRRRAHSVPRRVRTPRSGPSYPPRRHPCRRSPPLDVLRLINTQVRESVITPLTLILILILANRRTLLGAASNGQLARWVGGISIGAVAVVASVYVIQTALGWFGVG